MKVAIYPGSFNPFHIGHLDVIKQALKLFDKVIIARGINPDKDKKDDKFWSTNDCVELQKLIDSHEVEIEDFEGLLSEFILFTTIESGVSSDVVEDFAIIKGLRNGQDLEYEKNQQYWNEDLDVLIPFFYIIADRKYCHISSSAIRGLEKFKEAGDV